MGEGSRVGRNWTPYKIGQCPAQRASKLRMSLSKRMFGRKRTWGRGRRDVAADEGPDN